MELEETGKKQIINITVGLYTKQSAPVTLEYKAISGSVKASGSGKVTIPAGEMNTSFQVNVTKSYQVKNARFIYPGAATIDYSNENPFIPNWKNLVDKPEKQEKLVSYHIEYDGDLKHIATNGRENPVYVESTENKEIHQSINKKDEEEKNCMLTLREASEEGDKPAITTEQYEMKDANSTNPFHMETDELGLVARFNSDEEFTYYGTDNLIWVSSDESVANVRYPEQFRGEKAATYGADHTAPVEIVPTGKVGQVYFTLYALNNGIKGYTPIEVCRSVTLFCEPGKEPFLRIPSSSGKGASLCCNQNEKLDVCFISNLTAQNAEEAEKLSALGVYQLQDYPTEFKIEVFETDFAGKPLGEPVYTNTAMSTNKNTIGKMTIPKGIFSKISNYTEAVYTVKISAESLRAYAAEDGLGKKKILMSASASITVFPNPPKLKLGKLESYCILDDSELAITYDLDTSGKLPVATSLTIVDSDGNVALSEPLKEGANTQCH